MELILPLVLYSAGATIKPLVKSRASAEFARINRLWQLSIAVQKSHLWTLVRSTGSPACQQQNNNIGKSKQHVV